MPKGFFVTGTDTGVGKTIIAGALIKAIQFLGHTTGGMKPVESGCSLEGDVLIPLDGMFLKQYSGMNEPITLITPCCLRSPLAPLPASEIDGIPVHISEIRKAFDILTPGYETIVVEGIGGLMVPITKDYFTIDLIKDFRLPIIVVARPGLGTINHIMLTVQYALKEGLEIAGIVLNYTQSPENSLAEETNPHLLEQICPVPVIGIFPYLKKLDEQEIAKAAMKHLNLEHLKTFL
ncbi:MAG: dethiobiotin synthase [Nitrospiraceae bacterium]|nr:MAG: dethiobiotin synthase [Nitrospiraceae bacterium]